jgi:KaiC/GvpD/RAD55 family RecA-like ATPase
VHSESTYRALEAGADGVIDFRLDETSDPPRNLIRVRSMRSVPFDGRWHQLNDTENMEVALEK